MERFVRYARRPIDRRRVATEWDRAEAAGAIDRRIPDPSLNYNQLQTSSLADYIREFIDRACNFELPALLDIGEAGEGAGSTFTLLDYGCGLGRLCYAFTERFGPDMSHRYIGYEIHPEAVEFLHTAYADYPNVSFLSDRLALSDSYVEIRQSVEDADGVAAEDVVLADRVKEQIDLEFSHSVFTHMYRKPIAHVLRELQTVMPGSACVNTWLLVDEESSANVARGVADRKLPIRGDGFWTYDEKNPLMCTAYDIDVMYELYDAADHEILDVLWGTWSGRPATQQFTYQDVVISRPKAG